MPGVAFPPVGPVGRGSPPSSLLCAAQTATLPLSGCFACRSLPDTLPASVRSWCPLRAHERVEAPVHARAFGRPVPSSGSVVKERDGSPTFPSSPFVGMPRSQTPVVSAARALPRPGLLPSGACTPSAFPSVPLEGYPAVHDSTHFGAPSRGLPPRSLQLRPPIAGLARGVRS